MRIVFLIMSYVPHQVLTLKELVNNCSAHILSYHASIVHTYVPRDIDNFETHFYKDFSRQEICKQIIDFSPSMIVISGWMIPEYLWIAKKVKKELSIPVISYSDTQWYGTFTQRINSLLSPFYIRTIFSHIWVAGTYQYEYARHLGFKKHEIIYNSLSCDTELFSKVSIEAKKSDYPKRFLYIGKFIPLKGLDVLLQAWEEIDDKNGWELLLIGEGPLKENFQNINSLIVKDYLSQEELLMEMQDAGCFVLSSNYEHWGLVIHEAAAAGLPIICTTACGASPHFVIDRFNGFKVETGNVKAMKSGLEYIMNLTHDELISHSYNSRKLSMKITPEITAANLIQLKK